MTFNRWETAYNMLLLTSVEIIPSAIWWLFSSSFQQRYRLIGVGIVAVITFIAYSQIYRVVVSSRYDDSLNITGKIIIANQLIAECVYSLLRLAAQNKAITYTLTVSSVIAVGLHLGLPGQNQTFAFIYATLLFFQVLITQEQHLLSIGPIRTLTESEFQEVGRDPTSDQEVLKTTLENIGTDTANNIRLHHRIYGPHGQPVSTRQTVDLVKNARSLDAGEQTEPLDVLITYEIPEQLQGDHYLLHVVAQTGEGVSLLSATTWVERES